MTKKNTGSKLLMAAGAIVVAALTYAFWPRPVMVDLGSVAHAPLEVTINEEGKTRVREAYVVSAPVAGRLLRVDVKAGDAVIGGETTVARLLPLPPPQLDVRTREQAKAGVGAAEATLHVAQTDLKKARVEKELADLELRRARALREGGVATEATLDRAEQAARLAHATLEAAQAAIALREAELASARASLISFSESSSMAALPPAGGASIRVTAPVSGRVFRVMQESETALPAGAPILEIGDPAHDLEVVVELLSTDAVQVSAGDRVRIEKWGGPYPLNGVVERVEPRGFTKFSALGVEEQRVNAIVTLTDPLARREKLGHGYRVEARIVVWRADDALVVPASALFREGDGWAVFAVREGRARLQAIAAGRSNGLLAQVQGGLAAGEKIILYPGPSLVDGTRVKPR